MLHWKGCDIHVPEMRTRSVARFPCFGIFTLTFGWYGWKTTFWEHILTMD